MLTQALDRLAREQDVTRSAVVRIILELYLFNDVNLIAASEGISEVRNRVKVASAIGFIAFRKVFQDVIDGREVPAEFLPPRDSDGKLECDPRRTLEDAVEEGEELRPG